MSITIDITNFYNQYLLSKLQHHSLSFLLATETLVKRCVFILSW